MTFLRFRFFDCDETTRRARLFAIDIRHAIFGLAADDASGPRNGLTDDDGVSRLPRVRGEGINLIVFRPDTEKTINRPPVVVRCKVLFPRPTAYSTVLCRMFQDENGTRLDWNDGVVMFKVNLIFNSTTKTVYNSSRRFVGNIYFFNGLSLRLGRTRFIQEETLSRH